MAPPVLPGCRRARGRRRVAAITPPARLAAVFLLASTGLLAVAYLLRGLPADPALLVLRRAEPAFRSAPARSDERRDTSDSAAPVGPPEAPLRLRYDAAVPTTPLGQPPVPVLMEAGTSAGRPPAGAPRSRNLSDLQQVGSHRERGSSVFISKLVLCMGVAFCIRTVQHQDQVRTNIAVDIMHRQFRVLLGVRATSTRALTGSRKNLGMSGQAGLQVSATELLDQYTQLHMAMTVAKVMRGRGQAGSTAHGGGRGWGGGG